MKQDVCKLIVEYIMSVTGPRAHNASAARRVYEATLVVHQNHLEIMNAHRDGVIAFYDACGYCNAVRGVRLIIDALQEDLSPSASRFGRALQEYFRFTEEWLGILCQYQGHEDAMTPEDVSGAREGLGFRWDELSLEYAALMARMRA